MNFEHRIVRLQASLREARLIGAARSWARDVFYYTGVVTPGLAHDAAG